MKTVTENELKKLEEKIDKLTELMISNQQKIETRFNDLEKNQIKLDGELKAINTRLDTYKPALDKIPDLAEKVGELKNWKQIAIIVFTAAVTSIAWILRDGKI